MSQTSRPSGTPLSVLPRTDDVGVLHWTLPGPGTESNGEIRDGVWGNLDRKVPSPPLTPPLVTLWDSRFSPFPHRGRDRVHVFRGGRPTPGPIESSTTQWKHHGTHRVHLPGSRVPRRVTVVGDTLTGFETLPSTPLPRNPHPFHHRLGQTHRDLSRSERKDTRRGYLSPWGTDSQEWTGCHPHQGPGRGRGSWWGTRRTSHPTPVREVGVTGRREVGTLKTSPVIETLLHPTHPRPPVPDRVSGCRTRQGRPE